MYTIVPVIAAYLIGGIPFGLIIARFFGVKDIRTVGSGNIGATNVWRVLGFRAAVWVFIGDIGKGALVVLIGRWFAANYELTFLSRDIFLVVCAVVAVVGNVFPVYIGFKGGKGVNTALGAVLSLLPIETLISFAVFVIVVSISRYISLGSLTGVVCLLTVLLVEKFGYNMIVADVYIYLAAILTILIIITHRQNIARLLSGTENKFSFASKTKPGGSHA